MCGIAGFAGFEDKPLLKRMCKVISYRGPDDTGFYTGKNICLGQNRLSIIDLTKGLYPIHNESGSLVLVYNGEIYNFKEIQAELEKKGHKFYSNCDAEIIVHAYEQYGLKFVEKFNGMFAFALWDSKKKKLILGRDRLGIKPLHYTLIDNSLIFGSEIKSILQSEKVKREVDKESLHKFINFNYIFGEETLLKGIKRLMPGHLLIYENNKIQIKKYWEVQANISNKSEDFYKQELDKLLKDSIQRRLISDVPLGLALSGGIDSTLILAYMSELGTEPVKTYSIGFNEPCDELKNAKKVAEHFGTDHHEMIVESDILKNFPTLIWHMDTPKKNICPMFYLSELARESVKVVLTGLGGDELFGGYRRHKYYYKRDNLLNKTPSFIRAISRGLSTLPLTNRQKRGLLYLGNLHSEAKTYNIGVPLLIYDQDRPKAYGEKLNLDKLKKLETLIRPWLKGKGDFFNRVLSMEAKTYLTNDLLEYTDRQTMAQSIESRVPLLDHELVEFAFTIPASLKMQGKTGKYILKKVAQEKIPKFVLRKKKIGFTVSPYYWFKGKLGEYAKQILTKENVERLGYFNYSYIDKILSKPAKKSMYYLYTNIWNMMAFHIWHKIYIESDSLYKPNLDMRRFYG